MSSALVCAISGYVPDEPVVSSTGHIFERRLITQYIEENGRCPITGANLTLSDIFPLQNTAAMRPRTVPSCDLPSMLNQFQNEWDALVKESFSTRAALQHAKEQLAHALYQYEAACRVIARLTRERDDALQTAETATKTAVSDLQAAAKDSMYTPHAVSPALPASVAASVDELAGRLMQGRRKTKWQHHAFEPLEPVWALSGSSTCFALHPADRDVAIIGSLEGVSFLSLNSRQIGESFSIPSVTACSLHPNEESTLIAGTAGGSVVLIREGQIAGQLEFGSGVVSVKYHPSSEFALIATSSGNWATVDDIFRVLSSGKIPGGLATAAFHPDGALIGFGSGDRVLIFDLKKGEPAGIELACQGTVKKIAFAENGYLVAVASSAGAQLWDLRKGTPIFSLNGAPCTAAVTDDSCNAFAAVMGHEVVLCVFVGKTELRQVQTIQVDEATDLKWAAGTGWVVVHKDRLVGLGKSL